MELHSLEVQFNTPTCPVEENSSSAVLKRCRRPSWFGSRMCCCGSLTFFVLAIGLRWAAAALHGCGMRPWAIGPVEGSLPEMAWVLGTAIGIRNLAPVLNLLPGYGDVMFYSTPRTVGSGHWVALTFDDLVGENVTEAEDLLDILDDLDVKATFMVIANNRTFGSERRQRVLRRIADSGHEIANHGLEDDEMWGMGRREFDDALTTWETHISAVVPRWPVQESDRKWFRPPRMMMSADMAAALRDRDYTPVLGDVYADDWAYDDPQFLIKLMHNGVCDGSILVLHVAVPEPNGTNSIQTLQVVREGVPLLRARGFHFTRLSDLTAPEKQGAPHCGVCWSCVASIGVALVLFLAACLRVSFLCGRCSVKAASRCTASLRSNQMSAEGEQQSLTRQEPETAASKSS